MYNIHIYMCIYIYIMNYIFFKWILLLYMSMCIYIQKFYVYNMFFSVKVSPGIELTAPTTSESSKKRLFSDVFYDEAYRLEVKMKIQIYTFIYTLTFVRIYPLVTYIYMHKYIYIYIYMYLHISMFECVHTYVNTN